MAAMNGFFSDCAKPAMIGRVAIGSGGVKIITSVMPTGLQDVEEIARECETLDADIIEWRADFFEVPLLENFMMALVQFKKHCTKPVLWTMRTACEGGMLDIPAGDYVDLVCAVAESGLADAVDLELARTTPEQARRVFEAARGTSIPVVTSYHDFGKTPSSAEITARLLEMDRAGGDILKIALMPNSPEDVVSVMSATIETRRKSGKPVISMSMGPAGSVTRVSGNVFGSAATFASGRAASAPGQLSIPQVRSMLEIFTTP